MNILEQSEALKDIPEAALMREMQMPTGSFPQYLVLTEIKRRKRIRDEFQRREAQDIPTVAEEAVMGAGMPQQGIMQMAKSMAPQTSMGQNTGIANAAPRQPTMGMAEGGITRLREGGKVIRMGGAEFALFDDGEVYRIAPNGRRFKAPAGLAKGVREFAAQAELLQQPAQAEEITSKPEYTPPQPDPFKLPAELSPVTRPSTVEEIAQNYPELATQSAQIAMESVDTPASLEQIAAMKEKAELDAKIQQKLFPNIVAPNAIDISQLPPEEIQGTTKRGMPKGFMGDPRLQGGILDYMRGTGVPAATEPEQLMGQYTLEDAIAAFQARDPSTKPYANTIGEEALLFEAMGRDDPRGFSSQLAGLTTPRTDLPSRFFHPAYGNVDDEGVPYNLEDTAFMQSIEGLTVPEDILAQRLQSLPPDEYFRAKGYADKGSMFGGIEGRPLTQDEKMANAQAALQAEIQAKPEETAQTTDVLAQVTRPEQAAYSDPFLNPSDSGTKTTAQSEQETYSDILNPADSEAEMPVQPKEIDASPPGVFSLAKAKADAEKQLSGLGATKYTMDGEEFFVLKTGNVVRLNEDLDAVPVTGGTAMKVVEEAQRLGADLSKAPEGLTMPPILPYLNRIPLPNEISIGKYATDKQGNVIPGTLTTPKLDISNLETPDVIKAPIQSLANLMGVDEGSAATTKLSEAKTTLNQAVEPAPETVGGRADFDISQLPPAFTEQEKEDVLNPLVAPDVELEKIEEDATETKTISKETREKLNEADKLTKAIINQTGDTGIRAAGGAGTSASGVAKEALAQKGLNTDQWLAIAMIGAGLASGNPADIGKSVQAGLSYLQKDKQGKMAYDARMKEMASREKIAGINAAATAAGRLETRNTARARILFDEAADLSSQASLTTNVSDRIALSQEAAKLKKQAYNLLGYVMPEGNNGPEDITVPNAKKKT